MDRARIVASERYWCPTGRRFCWAWHLDCQWSHFRQYSCREGRCDRRFSWNWWNYFFKIFKVNILDESSWLVNWNLFLTWPGAGRRWSLEEKLFSNSDCVAFGAGAELKSGIWWVDSFNGFSMSTSASPEILHVLFVWDRKKLKRKTVFFDIGRITVDKGTASRGVVIVLLLRTTWSPPPIRQR